MLSKKKTGLFGSLANFINGGSSSKATIGRTTAILNNETENELEKGSEAEREGLLSAANLVCDRFRVLNLGFYLEIFYSM